MPFGASVFFKLQLKAPQPETLGLGLFLVVLGGWLLVVSDWVLCMYVNVLACFCGPASLRLDVC